MSLLHDFFLTSFKRSFPLLFAFFFTPTMALAQVEERTRPAEWENLILGGRYMDRFEPMLPGRVARANWGAESVRNRLVDNGIESDDMSFWGGNILKGEDGLYHLYVCGWPENSPQGHMFWGNSTIFHATSSRLQGPYKVQNSIGKGHNPEAYLLQDGRLLVYCIDGYYTATRPEGPWIYGKFQFDDRGHGIIEGLSNLTFCHRSDGSMLMVCRGGGVWISRDGLQPWQQITSSRIYPDVEGNFEDPVVWRDSLQYHLIVNDWLGRLAWYERSLDGLHWVVEPGEAYTHGFSRHADGGEEQWFKYERAKVFQDEYGRVVQMNFAVIDTLKGEDRPLDTHSSKNICIPLNRGLLLEVLNTKPIDRKTSRIELRIRGEKDFSPAQEIDVKSLLFGSYSQVNYGRGCKAIRSRVEGEDLIVTFSGKDSGIDEREWAPKLLGKTRGGKLVWGYARLPYVNYHPAILSSSAIVEKDGTRTVAVTNYGLQPSDPQEYELPSEQGGTVVVSVPALQPYEEKNLVIQ